MDVFQGKRGSKVKIDIAKFDLLNDFVLVFEGAPSYTDVQNLFGTTPGCPTTKRKSPKKNKKQLKKNAEQMLKKIKQNQIVFGFEFIAVSLTHVTEIILLQNKNNSSQILAPGPVPGTAINALFPYPPLNPPVVTSLTSRTNTITVWMATDSVQRGSGFEFKITEL